MRREFDQALQAAEQRADELNLEIKHQKEQRLLAESNWEAIVADKEEQLRKQTRKTQELESDLQDRINMLEAQL